MASSIWSSSLTMDDSTSISGSLTDFTSTHTGSRKRRGTSRSSTARPRTGVSTIGLQLERIVCAITEARGMSPTVGLAFINLDRAEAILCQIADTQTYSRTLQKLEHRCPERIIMSEPSPTVPSKLLTVMAEHEEQLQTEFVIADRRSWSEKDGLDYIHQLGFREDVDTIQLAVSDNYFALSCFAAAVKHIETVLSVTIAPNSLPIKFETSEDSMAIDSATIRSMELIQNLNNSRSKECLFGVLNKTVTPMGVRMLRGSILQPLTSRDKLEARYDAVQELAEREDVYFAVQTALKDAPDADTILTNLSFSYPVASTQIAERAINNILGLKKLVVVIGRIAEALVRTRSYVLTAIAQLCNSRETRHISQLIDATINEDAVFADKPIDLRNQRMYAVKSGHNGMLDVARVTYRESMEDALDHVKALGEEHDLALEFCFSTSREHYIKIPVSVLEDRDLPAVFLNSERNKKWIECHTLELTKRNQKIRDSMTEVLLLSDGAIQELIVAVREYLSKLFKISEGIAMLDLVSSFASLVTTQDYVRPTIGQAIALRASRHPIKEVYQQTTFVANDVLATSTRRFQILTGCNMSGKSTYIRAVALISIMAQVGSFVPAKQATIKIMKQLLVRISTDDSVQGNVSTFSSEMREMAYILANVNKDSLVIIDELGRGTSSQDGMAIALAIAEALVDTGALIWFATHFRDIATIMSEKTGVSSKHLMVDNNQDNAIGMLYKIAEGVKREDNYGLKLSKVLSFPEDMMEKAEQVTSALKQQAIAQRRVSPAVIHARRRKVVLQLREQLLHAQSGRMNSGVLADYLEDLQKRVVVQMGIIDKEASEVSEELEVYDARPSEDPRTPERQMIRGHESLRSDAEEILLSD